ncbi:MAG: glycosyltransferase family 4 protein [Fimbriimonadales bacterium]
MRILEIITPSRLGGAERYVGWISRELINRGHDVLIGIRKCDQVEDFYRSLDIPMRELRISGKLNPFVKSRTVSLINEFVPDVVHTHLSTASHWGLAAAKQLNVFGVGHMHSFNTVAPYKSASSMIAVSNAVKEHLAEHGISASVVYPSSVIGDVSPSPDVAALGTVIACAARLREDKGIGVLVEAFSSLGRNDVALVLCGDGPMKEQIEQRAATDRLNMHCLGYRPDVPSVFAASTIAVLPSIRPEGYGMALYEAQAVGTPVVGTRAGGSVEAMVDGVTGIAVPPNDVGALAAAMSKLLDDSVYREDIAANCKTFAEKRSISASVDALVSVFESSTRR